MINMKRIVVGAACTLLAAGFLIGQEEKKSETKKGTSHSAGGILHPEMTVAPDAGSYDKPMGTLGESGKEWTDTTVNAGVDKKPLPGKPVKVTGEIIDLSCYLQLGKHGEKH